MEAETTDIMTPVDIFYLDIDRLNGAELNRWITPYEMTGECNPAVQPFPANCYNSSGGITTQFAGAQPQRARLRATKAPTNLLNQPPRNIRLRNARGARLAFSGRFASSLRSGSTGQLPEHCTSNSGQRSESWPVLGPCI